MSAELQEPSAALSYKHHMATGGGELLVTLEAGQQLYLCDRECTVSNRKRGDPRLHSIIQGVSFPHPGMIPLSEIRCVSQQLHI